MADLKNINDIVEKIKIEKELLSTMPQNNDKNINKYKDKIEEIKKEYQKYQKDIIIELQNRYKKAVDIEKNGEIENLETREKRVESTLFLFNDDKDSYEKMMLDRNLYKIRRYYKDSFEGINEQILMCIEKFEKLGIELDISDFEYSIYVKEYMEIFLQELPNKNSEKLKEKFEELYWKCPDIIIHIVLNFRSLYFKYQQQIDKSLEKTKNELLKAWEKTPKEIMKVYLELKEKKDDLIKKDKKILLDKFLEKKLKTKDFEKNKIEKELKEIYENEKIKNKEELGENITKLLESLKEYENILEFDFILRDIKNYYKEKETYKKSYNETKKEIDKLEKKISSINRKIIKPGIFSKGKDYSKELVQQNKLILELDELYKKLDLNNCYTKISNNLQDNSTIYDVLKIAASSYYYLTTLIIKNQSDIEEEEIEEKIERLENFLKSPYNNIINNMTILEEKNIALIIKDRYNLLNFTIEKEDLSIDTIEDLISKLEKIEIYYIMQKIGLDTEKIKELQEIKEIK